MTILTPATAVDGANGLIITGTGMSGTPKIVATNGSKYFTQDLAVNSQSATSIDIDLDVGLTATISSPLLANEGVPLTDGQWSLKWVVGSDELDVAVSAPANHQSREVSECEKFGGILADIELGEQDQLVAKIVTGTNTISLTDSNGKATGSFVGIERTMDETITGYIFTSRDGRWRSREVEVSTFYAGLRPDTLLTPSTEMSQFN